MKVYSISQWTFFGICVLILALPVSRQWKLLSSGKKTTGRVTEFSMVVRENMAGEREIQYVSKLEFKAGDRIYEAYGPAGYEYAAGREVKLKYNPADPTEHCLLTFSAFYLNSYLVLPLVLITVWGAFYLSFNSYSKNKGGRQSREVAFSPYGPRKKRNPYPPGPGVPIRRRLN